MRPFQFLFLILAATLAGCSEQRVEPPAPKGGDFVLQAAGGPLDTRALRGKVLLIYFGYTHCPDVCPASLAAGAQALNTLTAEERTKVRLIMVSIDPERDTPERLKEYTAYFHPEMVGVTGTPEEIAAVAKSFGAGYLRQPARPDGSYAVDHTTRTYVVAPDGKLAASLELNAPAEKYLETVRGLLK
jgi:protein SCO1/2